MLINATLRRDITVTSQDLSKPYFRHNKNGVILTKPDMRSASTAYDQKPKSRSFKLAVAGKREMAMDQESWA